MTQGADPVNHVFLEPLQISAEASQKIPTAWDKNPTAWDFSGKAPQIDSPVTHISVSKILHLTKLARFSALFSINVGK